MSNERQILLQKMQRLLPHWQQHNDEHINEMERWQHQLLAQELTELAQSIADVVVQMKTTGQRLQQAQDTVTTYSDKSA
ncbi:MULTISPECIES: hypothetical protein [Ferrimonas]|uniref:hypothetical protein n=1 Tax=Ferrimonas TaxID=44011 RepID=UPI0003F5AE40|nr:MULTISPECIES: hypothetical protein [Ferrimonas]USD36397.1 hypothetical protein J8Z22_15420 [Ferrimonas sp. SCSIO 43195]